MKPVTVFKRNCTARKRRPFYGALAVFLWLGLWETAALIIKNPLFLPAPVPVAVRFFQLAKTSAFWDCVFFSVRNIASGFLLGTASGLLLAGLSYLSPLLEAVFSLPLKIIRAMPVASFIILALLWISSARLSVLISFLMVLPILYTSCLSGLKNADAELLEMASVFGMPAVKRLRRIYLPALFSHLSPALATASGLAWKSGIAAEIIGITKQSIGNRIYQSKIYLETTELFAWSITVILISIIFEKIISFLMRKAAAHVS